MHKRKVILRKETFLKKAILSQAELYSQDSATADLKSLIHKVIRLSIFLKLWVV